MFRNIYPQPQRCYQTMVSTVSLQRSHDPRRMSRALLVQMNGLGSLLGDWVRLPDGRVMT